MLGTRQKSQPGEEEKPLIAKFTGNLETAAARRELLRLSMLMCDGSLDTASWSALSSGTGKLVIVLVLLHISLILSAV